jgi:hypothetical protein
VFWLGNEVSPPFHGFSAFGCEPGLALGAIEVVASVWEAADATAVTTMGDGERGMTVFKDVGKVWPTCGTDFGGGGVFMDCLFVPELDLPRGN